MLVWLFIMTGRNGLLYLVWWTGTGIARYKEEGKNVNEDLFMHTQ